MMWVMNQDKITVAQVDALSIDYRDLVASQATKEEERPKFYRIWGQVAEHDYVMGTYKTLDKAKEVLGEFYKALRMQGVVEFTMPADDDNVVLNKEVQ